MSGRFGPQQALHPQPVPRDFIEQTYASPHGIDLEVRIWPASGSRPAPWVLWCHGGGSASGSHYAPPSWLFPGLVAREIHLVTMAYRLSPHAGLAEQVEDCVASYGWCRTNLARVLDRPIDIDRYAVGGDSAGGLLATLLPFKLSPPPKGVMDVYGNVDLLSPKHWDIVPPSQVDWAGRPYPLEAILEELQTRDPTKAIVHAPFPAELASVPEATTQHRWAAPAFAYTDRVRFQTALKDYLGLSRSSVFYLLRLDELPDTAACRARAREWSPMQLVDGRADYPPTAFLHGTADEAVSVQISRELAAKLRALGVPTLESYEEGAPHAFDMIYTDPGVNGWETYITPVLDYVEKHLRE